MSLIQGELRFRGISFGPSGVQVCSDCCVGHALFQRGALAVLERMEDTGTAQAQPSLSQEMCWEVFIIVYILISISGDSGFSTPSWDRLIPRLEASFPSENLRGSQGAGLTTHGHLE